MGTIRIFPSSSMEDNGRKQVSRMPSGPASRVFSIRSSDWKPAASIARPRSM